MSFKKLTETTTVASKTKLFGETFNTKELLEALRNPAFNHPEGPVVIDGKDKTLQLTLIYVCSLCDKLHLVCGHSQEEIYETHFDHEVKIFENIMHEEGYGITKFALIDILENLPEVMPVCLQTYGEGFEEKGDNLNDNPAYTLSEIYKCNSCEAIHLSIFYEQHSHHTN